MSKDGFFVITKDIAPPFGKYVGMPFEKIAETDPKYVGWFAVRVCNLPNLGSDFIYDKWFEQYKEMYRKNQNKIMEQSAKYYKNKNSGWAEDYFTSYGPPDFF